ncbi:hypothetical protein Hanom_Chr03g00203771 [Helianthus anomalus]
MLVALGQVAPKIQPLLCQNLEKFWKKILHLLLRNLMRHNRLVWLHRFHPHHWLMFDKLTNGVSPQMPNQTHPLQAEVERLYTVKENVTKFHREVVMGKIIFH